VPVKPVRRLPDRVLKDPSGELESVEAAEPLITDLIDTMRASPACVGLAAPQLGVSARAFVIDVSGHPKSSISHGLIAMINSTVLEWEGREVGREGCMSVPDLTANVSRWTRVVIEGVTQDGTRVIETRGFEARAFQHEIDHLDGLLILDRVASLATDVFRRKVYR
jgi:peptide deformylase